MSLYCEAYVVVDPMETTLEEGQVLRRRSLPSLLIEEFGPNFQADIGGNCST